MLCDKLIKIKMIDIVCTCCCCGYSSTKQESTSRYSFPKKLLVATSVVVIIAMCLTPSEAHTLEHKIRHERRYDTLTQPTKDISRTRSTNLLAEHKRRPHRKQTKDTAALIRQKNELADRFKNSMTNIKKKLKNTRGYFNEERRVLNETKEYREGMPSWLPTINFVDIHFHNYKNPRRTGASVSERKFTYLMPKLYKSLVEYQDIFTHLIKVEVSFADDPFYVYNKTRQDLIGKILYRLNSTIFEIEENMISVSIPVPPHSPNKNIVNLDLKVDAPRCLKNDYIAFRAYGNLLNNWYYEFRCPNGKRVISDNRRCAFYEAKLKEKKDTRIPKSRKNAS